MTTRQPITARNPRIDLLRGWLIFLVVVGHIVLGSVHDNFIRYAIYSFHMPLFIGLTGYLVNPDKLKSSSLFAVGWRYWWRVGLPFMLAFLFFTGVLLLHASREGRLDNTLVISYLVTPYYHLWFVPTLVLWVLGFWLSLKLRIPIIVLLLVMLALSAIWSVFPAHQLPAYLAVLLSKKVVYFFSFFLFGAWLRTPSGHRLLRAVMTVKVIPMAVVLMTASIYLVQIGVDKSSLKGLAWLLMNCTLVAIGVQWAKSTQSKKPAKRAADNPSLISNIMIVMGRISLPIYLWHVVPMFLLKGWDIHETQPLIYYAVSIASVAAIIALLIWLENKFVVTNKLVYGN
ncbi:acyltransferase family protein [Arenicella xantha]|uniref:Acyltransferase-like protein n=1 Tax=Arenicella xantha TaxID=644221 RepID=A0A395JNP6_9GAMM|nr:acyltransferase [Arenicella xantha]RBP53280.1 acyltransferase-like protein [Arenicella xantha]